MPSAPKILGQANPAAAIVTTLYTVPALTSTHVTMLSVCAGTAYAASFRVWVRPGAQAQAAKHRLYYDTPIAGNDTFIANIAVMLEAAAVIEVWSSDTTLSFTLTGVEIA